MELNRKGFMMAEVIVVSSIILIFLATLYTSYNQIYQIYKTRLNYYDATVIYRLGYYRDVLIENDTINDKLAQAKDSKSILIYDKIPTDENEYEFDTVILGYIAGGVITPEEIIVDGINQTYKDYINYLKTSSSINSNYVMLIERCNEEKTNCKYGYIKIYDGNEG